MAQFKAFSQGVEVYGQTVLSLVAGMSAMPSFKATALRILSVNGIDDPKPDQWYSQQAWLNAFKEIAEKVGALTLHSIGKKIPENAQWPPSVNSLETALASIDVAYHMNHRLNGKVMFDPATGKMTEGIGHYGFEKLGEKKAKMVCKNPYPSDFDRGLIEAAAKKFAPSGAFVTVAVTDDGRKSGGDSSTYSVEW
ncbi:MAG: hypothetical protein ABSD38_17225 [Syntrophorhabdales bacterium]|jgi:hypothetical protein